MQSINPGKKTKIILSDYPYLKDLENRLLMSNFSTFDFKVLETIIDGSLTTNIDQLCEDLESDEALIEASLDKLSKTGLFVKKDKKIVVDKDVRKYYEAQIVKFDDDFVVGIEYIKSLLKKAPIDVLPGWYAIPRTADDIFESIIEKYLLTPKIYLKHLEELSQDSPLYDSIIKDLHSAPDHKIPTDQLCKKYKLSKEQFEELMLHLEFNFVGFISYQKMGEMWVEVVTPFNEWTQYLKYQKAAHTFNLLPVEKVEPNPLPSFYFVKDLVKILDDLKAKPKKSIAFNPHLLTLLKDLHLVDHEEDQVTAIVDTDRFLALPTDRQAHILFRMFLQGSDEHPLYTEKAAREVEKSLYKLPKTGWILFDDFIKGCSACVGSVLEISLRKIGKSWCYKLPQYSDKELELIKLVVLEKFSQAGIIDKGTFLGKDCFRISEYGAKFL